MKAEASRVSSAVLRVAAGAVWLFEAYPKLRDNYLGSAFSAAVQSMAANNPWHFYGRFLQQIVLTHVSIFAYLTLVGDVVVGACLLLGLLTPYAALAGIFLNINYALAAGWLDRMNYSLNGLLIVIEVVVIAAAAGRIAGLDAVLGRGQRPRHRRY